MWHKIIKEPLVYFFLVAFVLFSVNISQEREKDSIVLDDDMVHYIIDQREKLQLKSLSLEEKKQVINTYIDNELLYKEAQRRGLDNDARIKKQMIQKMSVVLTSEVPEPNDIALQAYYKNHKEHYAKAASRDIEQVFFATTTPIPEGFLEQLSEDETLARTQGDSSMFFGAKFYKIRDRELITLLGKEAAKAILSISDSQWHGPITSTLGQHFIKLTQVYPKEYASYSEVKAYLVQDYTLNEHKKQLRQALDKLREKQTLTIAWPE